jgi:FixJ family two-component response regulator
VNDIAQRRGPHARKRQTSQQLNARRREVVNLTHKGWTQAAIASHLQIPQGTVCRDLAAMRSVWRDFPVYDIENVRFEQLQKIDLVEAVSFAI